MVSDLLSNWNWNWSHEMIAVSAAAAALNDPDWSTNPWLHIAGKDLKAVASNSCKKTKQDKNRTNVIIIKFNLYSSSVIERLQTTNSRRVQSRKVNQLLFPTRSPLIMIIQIQIQIAIIENYIVNWSIWTAAHCVIIFQCKTIIEPFYEFFAFLSQFLFDLLADLKHMPQNS